MDTSAYIFDTEAKARKFCNSVIKLGLDAKQIGNAVIANYYTLATVLDHFMLDDEDRPVWTNGDAR